jgi:hypothetical protein
MNDPSREPSQAEIKALWARLDEHEARKVAEEAEAKERAKVVTWLRAQTGMDWLEAADAIEAGAHRTCQP